MAHTNIDIPNNGAWNDTGLDGPVTFWVPSGSFLMSTGATQPASDDDARSISVTAVNGETVTYGGTDRLWIKPLVGAGRIVQEV